VDRLLDWKYHLELARTGAYFGYDNIGKEKYAPDRERLIFIRRLVDEGYGRQLLVSGDMSRKSYWASFGGGPGLVNILLQFVPALRREGLKDTAIEDILVHNPARVLRMG
jgi:5-phospho-D-xylono-1,4-lactonase